MELRACTCGWSALPRSRTYKRNLSCTRTARPRWCSSARSIRRPWTCHSRASRPRTDDARRRAQVWASSRPSLSPSPSPSSGRRLGRRCHGRRARRAAVAARAHQARRRTGAGLTTPGHRARAAAPPSSLGPGCSGYRRTGTCLLPASSQKEAGRLGRLTAARASPLCPAAETAGRHTVIVVSRLCLLALQLYHALLHCDLQRAAANQANV